MGILFMEILIKKLNDVYFKIQCEISQSLELKAHLSCYVKNYRFHPRFKSKIWDGKISFYNMVDHTIPIGLLPQFFNFLKKFDYKCKFDFDTSTMSNDISLEQVEKLCKTIVTKLEPRDYQIESVYKSLKNKRGVVVAATSAGKSLIIYLLIRILLTTKDNFKMMLVVPSVSLVNQMYQDFKDYGWNDITSYVTKVYSGQKMENKNVVITTYQSMTKKSSEIMEQFDGVIVDETHTSKSISVATILKKLVNAEYRIGFTGTMPTELDDQLNIYGFLGPKIYEIGAKKLIERGVLSSIKIANVQLMYPPDIVKKQKNRTYPEEVSFTTEYKKRN